jgi:predicted dehydrogenase
MKKKLSIGVIGCGYWGPNLIRNFNSAGDSTVKIVCDKSEQRLDHIKSLYPAVQTTTDAEAVFNDPGIDAVAIATPVHSHFMLAKESLLSGKHVFIEKPMASSVAQCRELNRLAEENGLTLMVGHTFIYSDPVRKIKELLDSGEIGKIYYFSSQRLNLGLYQNDINVAWDLAAHDISIVLYLFQSMPISVSCQGKAHITPGIEDVTVISMDFSSSEFAMVTSSWLDPHKVRKIVIVGSKKMIVYDDIEPIEKIKIYDKCVRVPDHYDLYGDFAYSYHYGDVLSPYFKMSEPVRNECLHFIECVQCARKPLSSGKEGLEVVQILEAATESLRRNSSKVPLDTLTDHPAAFGGHPAATVLQRPHGAPSAKRSEG